MRFTTPCFVAVENSAQATSLLKRIGWIGSRKIYELSDDVSFPTICVSSTNIALIHRKQGDELASAGFIDCGKNESLFIALSALTDNNDYWMQWLVKNDVSDKANWSFNTSDEISTLGQQLGYRRATAEELIAYFG